MKFSSKKECESTRKFNALASIARPMAMQIARGQHLFNATFPDNERVENALVDLYIKNVNTQKWNLLMSEKGYLHNALRNTLCNTPSYDRNRELLTALDPDRLRRDLDGDDADPAFADGCSPGGNAPFGYTREDMLCMPEEETAMDAYACFLKAIFIAFESLPQNEALILNKGRYEAVKVSGKLRVDEEAFYLHREKGLGTLVTKSMPDSEIASIVGIQKECVRVRRNQLKEKLLRLAEEEFRRLYRGPSCDRQLSILVKRLELGKYTGRND